MVEEPLASRFLLRSTMFMVLANFKKLLLEDRDSEAEDFYQNLSLDRQSHVLTMREGDDELNSSAFDILVNKDKLNLLAKFFYTLKSPEDRWRSVYRALLTSINLNKDSTFDFLWDLANLDKNRKDEFDEILFTASHIGKPLYVDKILKLGDLHKIRFNLDNAISVSRSKAVSQILIRKGANKNKTSHFTKLEFINSSTEYIKSEYNIGPFKDLDMTSFIKRNKLTRESYIRLREFHRGQKNPDLAQNGLWLALIRNSASHYEIGKYFNITQVEISEFRNPWNISRIGQSTNVLPDGRIIDIGGRYGFFFDRNFVIYNDVIVYSPGDKIEIYNYPIESFSPTDYHTATPIGDQIIICGGSPNSNLAKTKETPIFSLDLKTYKITKLKTTGDSPGRIYRHKAKISHDGKSILYSDGTIQTEKYGEIENTNEYKFDPARLSWSLTKKNPSLFFSIKRQDNGRLALRDLKDYMVDELKEVNNLWLNEFAKERVDKLDISHLKAIYSSLYAPPVKHKPLTAPSSPKEQKHSIQIDGAKVNYTESWGSIQLAVYGDLSSAKLNVLKNDFLDKLSKIEQIRCIIE